MEAEGDCMGRLSICEEGRCRQKGVYVVTFLRSSNPGGCFGGYVLGFLSTCIHHACRRSFARMVSHPVTAFGCLGDQSAVGSFNNCGFRSPYLLSSFLS